MKVPRLKGMLRRQRITALTLSILIWGVMQTYPMMYPGFDIWWHVDVINSVDHFQGHAYGRWHWVWNRLFRLTEISDVFEQALIVHRTQFTLAVLLVFISAKIILSTAYQKSKLPEWLTAILSFMSVLVWLVMHGTTSSTAFGGDSSEVTLSWINWYSVSHQIALPIYLFGISLLLYLLGSETISGKKRGGLAILVSVTFVLVALIHAAELPYFLYMLAVTGLVYQARSAKRVGIFALFTLLVCTLAIIVSTKLGYGSSALIGNLASGSWSATADSIRENGQLLVGGMNRGETSWNGVYTLALCMTLFVAIGSRACIDARSILFAAIWIALSGLMPAMLFEGVTAGILAQVTYPLLAWRFSFASFLFAAPALFFATCYLLLKNSNWRALSLLLFSAVISLGSLQYFDKFAPVRRNAGGLLASISPEKIRFGLQGDQILELEKLKKQIENRNEQGMACVDLFSSYYLHYYLKVRNICLPPAVLLAPSSIIYYSSRQGIDEVRRVCLCNYAPDAVKDGPQSDLSLKWDEKFLK